MPPIGHEISQIPGWEITAVQRKLFEHHKPLNDAKIQEIAKETGLDMGEIHDRYDVR